MNSRSIRGHFHRSGPSLPNCQALTGGFRAMTRGFVEILAQTIRRPLSENELGAALSLAFYFPDSAEGGILRAG
jgi:hypothetical protein